MRSLRHATYGAALAVSGRADATKLSRPLEFAWSYADQDAWSSQQGWSCGNQSGYQSPIDLASDIPETSSPVPLKVSSGGKSISLGQFATWNYTWPMVDAELNTHPYGWEVRLLEPFYQSTVFTFMGKDFMLRSIRYTAPSETLLDGKAFDMEAQHMHEAADGQELVASVLLRVGLVPENEFLSQMWGNFPQPASPAVAPWKMTIVNPFYGSLPRDRSHYAFKGSGTMPPCRNDTAWVVFKEPVPISRNQRDVYRQALDLAASAGNMRLRLDDLPPEGTVAPWDVRLGMNSRRVQVLGSRRVQFFAQAAEEQELANNYNDHLWAWIAMAAVGLSLFLGFCALALLLQQQASLQSLKADQALSSPRRRSEVSDTDTELSSGPLLGQRRTTAQPSLPFLPSRHPGSDPSSARLQSGGTPSVATPASGYQQMITPASGNRQIIRPVYSRNA